MMATIYLNSKNYNYIILFHDYYCSVQPLAPTCPHLIGKVFGPGIDKLVSLGLPAENLEFAGQSAGAHIVASVIENMVTPVKLLIGFDPGTALTDFRRGLAQFTIALRSDSTNSGNINWNADLELIVNGGIRYQPGCEELEFQMSCSHLFVGPVWKSIFENQGHGLFYGVRCNEIECDYSDIKEITPDLREKGTYYFKTSDSYPFGLGLDGIKNITPTKNSTFNFDWEFASIFMKHTQESWLSQLIFHFD
ncbi:uncharacterized protein LOC123306196 [Chrysoperla carnea]|uniref:uncharacterized protein LOC123306196 n=1 Tax=Chrysoperla carnea TaxID=189513 RepID=UPI001D07E38F|nr:uncharacterized protein LOC123306196 [Chrysoperla carnea]